MPHTPAIEACFRERYPDLVRFLHGMLGDRDAAEDAAQEAFRRLLHRGPAARPDADRWVFSVARRIALDLIKTDRRRVERERYHVMNHDSSDTAQADDEALRTAVGRIPERLREVLLLQVVSDLSVKEIAGIVGRSAGAVKQDLYRARVALRHAWLQQQRTDP